MNILIKSATILDKSSKYHKSTKDILIENGVITKVENTIKNTNNYNELNVKNLHVSRGWFDSSVSFGEPGFEERETIANGIKTACLSGFADIAVQPNTNPIIDNSVSVSFIKNSVQNSCVNIHPIGALTKKSNGIDLAELYDMKKAGAKAFGDYQSSIENPNMLKISLQYAQSFGGLVLSYPQENRIAGKGIVNEEENATKMGLKGIPNLAEELQIARDLFLLEYTGGKLHIPTISTAKSVSLIREAKAKKLDISCSVSILNLLLTDDAITDFDTNYKVLPPLRTKLDQEKLIEGVNDGTIDFVTSNHLPIDIENKKVEFDHAMNGSIGLESLFGALQTIFDTEKVIEILTQNKLRFGVNTTSIKVGEKACLSLFNPYNEYTFTLDNIYTTSKNTALLGIKLKGEALGVINNNQILIKK
ncbi:dihydroorotase [Flavobacteriaceae bacterium]|nr:dihydroorotase [Flavobacteriaceae bacterium]